jgi:hypothetical protein
MGQVTSTMIGLFTLHLSSSPVATEPERNDCPQKQSPESAGQRDARPLHESRSAISLAHKKPAGEGRAATYLRFKPMVWSSLSQLCSFASSL